MLAGASVNEAFWYCWAFTVARLAHWGAYLAHLQPWRAICYLIGYLSILGMSVQILF